MEKPKRYKLIFKGVKFVHFTPLKHIIYLFNQIIALFMLQEIMLVTLHQLGRRVNDCRLGLRLPLYFLT